MEKVYSKIATELRMIRKSNQIISDLNLELNHLKQIQLVKDENKLESLMPGVQFEKNDYVCWIHDQTLAICSGKIISRVSDSEWMVEPTADGETETDYNPQALVPESLFVKYSYNHL